MATKKEEHALDAGEKQIVSLLQEHIPKDATNGMPKQANDWMKGLLGALARSINGWVGEQTGNAFLKFAQMRGVKDDATLAAYHKMGDRTGRAAITLYSKIAPGYGIVRDFFKGNSTIKKNFAEALRAEGAGNGLFGAKSDLEVVRHMRDVTAKSTTYRTQGYFLGLVTQGVPTLLLNEAEMVVKDIKEHYEYEFHKRNKDDTTASHSDRQKSLREFQRMEKERKAPGKAELFAIRNTRAQKNILWMNNHAKWIPSEDGTSGDSLLNSIAAFDTTFNGDFSKGDGLGRVSFLEYLKTRAGIAYEFFAPKLLGKFTTDKFTPKAKELLAKPSAGQMILTLQDALKDTTNPLRLTLPNGKNCRLDEYIYEIFAQHNQDMGRKPFSSAMIDELKDSCELIAQAMTDPNRRLHPQAMAFLVDRKYGILTYEGGKASGVKQDAALEDHIQLLIEKKNLSKRDKRKPDQYYNDMRFTRDELVASWQNLTESEKLVWGTFLNDEVMRDAGETPENIKNIRRQRNELLFDVIEEVMEEFRKHSPKELEEAGVSPKLVKEMNRLVDAMKHDKQNYMQEHQQEVMAATVELAVKLDNIEQSQDRPAFISRIIEQAEERRYKKENPHEEVSGYRAPKSFQDRLHEARGEEGPGNSNPDAIRRKLDKEKPAREAHRRGERASEGVGHHVG